MRRCEDERERVAAITHNESNAGVDGVGLDEQLLLAAAQAGALRRLGQVVRQALGEAQAFGLELEHGLHVRPLDAERVALGVEVLDGAQLDDAEEADLGRQPRQ